MFLTTKRLAFRFVRSTPFSLIRRVATAQNCRTSEGASRVRTPFNVFRLMEIRNYISENRFQCNNASVREEGRTDVIKDGYQHLKV